MNESQGGRQKMHLVLTGCRDKPLGNSIDASHQKRPVGINTVFYTIPCDTPLVAVSRSTKNHQIEKQNSEALKNRNVRIEELNVISSGMQQQHRAIPPCAVVSQTERKQLDILSSSQKEIDRKSTHVTHHDTLSEEDYIKMSLHNTSYEDSSADYNKTSWKVEREIGQKWDQLQAAHTKTKKEQHRAWRGPHPSKYYCIPQDRRVLPNEAYYLKEQQKDGPLNVTLKLYYQEKTKNPECGWFLFVRFHRNGFDELKSSLSKTRTSTLRIHGGRVTGIALADQVHKIEGTDDSFLQTKFTRRGETWYRQQNNEKNDMCILVMGFHNYNDLESWVKRDNNFKQHDFPAQYGYEAFAAALNYVPANDKECLTFLLTEYADVKDSDADAFREYAHTYTRVLERYCSMPYVIKTFGSQHIKGTWIKPKSIVTLSLFPSSRHVRSFFEDDDYKRIRFEQDRLSNTTSIYFTLNEFV